MTIDITELAQSLKEPAKQAIELGCINNYAKGRHAVLLFKSRATPEAVLSLVEALEKAKQRIAELEDAEKKLCAANVTLDARAELAERQLESRTVKLPKKNIGWDRDEDDCWNNAIDACTEALTAAGIKVAE
ncbi:TPA: hypothetical protein ACS3AL_001644 [Raoultella ornithinolytica]